MLWPALQASLFVPTTLLPFNKGSFNDLHINNGTVTVSDRYCSNTINYIYTFYHLAKYGILLIERRAAANGFIYFAVGCRYLVTVKPGLYLVQVIIVIHPSLHQKKLAAIAFAG